MRKVYLFLILTLVASFMTPQNLYADTMEINPSAIVSVVLDGIEYQLYDGGVATVKKVVTQKKHVVVRSEIVRMGKSYPVTEIESCAFFMFDHIDKIPTNPLIETITLPNTITKIEDGAFRGNKRLLSINIPESVTFIGDGAFDKCISLQYINIPEGVKEIYDNTFSQCHNLRNIVIPESVKKIGMYAFNKCPKLELVRLLNPNTVIHSTAFAASDNVRIEGGGIVKNFKKTYKVFDINGNVIGEREFER